MRDSGKLAGLARGEGTHRKEARNKNATSHEEIEGADEFSSGPRSCGNERSSGTGRMANVNDISGIRATQLKSGCEQKSKERVTP